MRIHNPQKLLPVLISLLPLILAQSSSNGGDTSPSSDFLQDYLTYLNQSGYTSLSNALVQANQTSSGQAWLAKVEQQVQNEGGSVGRPWTVFVPTNQAFQSVPDSVTQNTTLLSEILSYHFVYGNLQNFTSTGNAGGGNGGSTSSQTYSSTTSPSSESSIGIFPSPTSSGAGQPSLPGAGGTDGGPGGPAQTGTQTSPNSTPSAFASGWNNGPNNSSSNNGLQLLSGVWPNTTVGRTLLNDSSIVQLEGNRSQVLVWTRSGVDGNVTVMNQPYIQVPSIARFHLNNVTVTNGTQWRNFFLVEIDGILSPPGNVTTALLAVNDTPLVTWGSQIQEARGFTLFAPACEAFTEEVNQTIGQFQGNETALADLIQNHYINGSTVYSPTLQQLGVNTTAGDNSTTTYYSAAGEPFTVSYNSSGLFVSNGDSSARVTRPDILVENGVIHLIDRPLFDVQANSDAASSAYASATSAAAQTSTDTYAIGTGVITAPAQTSNTGGGQTSSTQQPSSSSETESAGTSTASSAATPSSFRIRRGLRIPE
ncbi:hypothetical protein MD484_g4619, partial [Candolleomyces efflorescens]